MLLARSDPLHKYMQSIHECCIQMLLCSINDEKLALRDLCEIGYILKHSLVSDGVVEMTAIVQQAKASYDQVLQETWDRRVELITAFQMTVLDVCVVNNIVSRSVSETSLTISICCVHCKKKTNFHLHFNCII